MARTQAGTQLTQDHRLRQVAVRARTLQEFLILTQLWDISRPQTFNRVVEAAIPLVEARHGTSASQAAAYFEAFRTAENIPGRSSAVIADPLERDRIARSLYATGEAQARRSLDAGVAAGATRSNTIATMSGAVTRLVLDGGRHTLLESSVNDRQSVSWMRVTGPNPCAFCAMLASRGPAYTSSEAAGQAVGRSGRVRGSRQIGESYHDHCVCSLEPYYEGSSMPDDSQQYREMWDRAQREGDVSGTSNDALNNFRRLLGGQLTTAA